MPNVSPNIKQFILCESFNLIFRKVNNLLDFVFVELFHRKQISFSLFCHSVLSQLSNSSFYVLESIPESGNQETIQHQWHGKKTNLYHPTLCSHLSTVIPPFVESKSFVSWEWRSCLRLKFHKIIQEKKRRISKVFAEDVRQESSEEMHVNWLFYD